MTLRTYGTLKYQDGSWILDVEPHVAMAAKRVFGRISKGAKGTLALKDSDAVCRDLEWFLSRYPLKVRDRERLMVSSRRHVERMLTLDRIVGGSYQPRACELALPLREYQRVAVDLHRASGTLVLADDVGLGKTAVAIGTTTDARLLPALVVTYPHLVRQWLAEFQKFAPALYCHEIKKQKPYEIPLRDGRGPDVFVSSYNKLRDWDDVLCRHVKSTIWDEGQELRKPDSQKYRAARQINESVSHALALTATPIYNYGGEIFNVYDCLKPGVLGDVSEFSIEWCEGTDRDKQRLKDPVAFGSYLREQHLMLRRTRREVGRELPALQRIIQPVDSDAKVFESIEDQASELARIILAKATSQMAGMDRFHASAAFDVLMRQVTGLAKAPHVAAFVRLLLSAGEPVVLYGWHRAVYDVWLAALADYRPAMFTGSESPAKKSAEFARFMGGETNVLIMSLRSGVGLDGLQKRCRTVVVGELDWSPGVIEQCLGRVVRDGQPDPVVCYFMLARDGADPIMAETLGLKREQVEGLRDLGNVDLERLERNDDALKQLAAKYLKDAPVDLNPTTETPCPPAK